MKRIALLVAMLLMVWTGGALSSPIDWVTISPTTEGALVYNFEDGNSKIMLGTDSAGRHGQEIGTYGAGFYTGPGGLLDFSIAFSTWDSSYYDQLLVTTSSNGFLWDSPRDSSRETIIQLGGKSWTDGTLEKLGVDNLHLSLGAGKYLSIALTTTYDALFASEAMVKIGFSENSAPAPAPVPEPATMMLFGTGLAGLAGVSFRRKK